MARRRAATLNPWQVPENRDMLLDGMFRSMAQAAGQALSRDDISIGTSAEDAAVGLPLPALCLRYLFQSTVFPLGKIIQLTGEEGSCKTSFLMEIARWHHVFGGGSVHIENENKDSPTLRYSMLQWNQHWLARHDSIPTYTMNEMMAALTNFLKIGREMLDAEGGPGRTVPIAFLIDSIMGTAPQELIDKVKKEGFTGRSFPLAALMLSDYMRTIPEMMKKYPFTIVGTNHLKPATDYQGRPINRVPGGKSVKFMETFEVEMQRAPGCDIDKLEFSGIRVKFLCRKNSVGPSRKQMVAEMLWWPVNIEGRPRQLTMWDWGTASIELMLNFSKINGKKTIYNTLMDICPIRVVNESKRLAHSPLLGVGSRDEPAEYRQIAYALEQRPDVLQQIHAVLGIAERRAFQPGVDFRESLAAAEAGATDGSVSAGQYYANVANMPQVDADALDPQNVVVNPDGPAPEIDPDDVLDDIPAAGGAS